jgi:murein DD-endopeptidase MepM/ murein hydrolase activator NlpD
VKRFSICQTNLSFNAVLFVLLSAPSLSNAQALPLGEATPLLLSLHESAHSSEIELNGPIAWPVTGPHRISSGYGPRRDPLTGKNALHGGVDIAAASGTGIVAIAPGWVTYAGWRDGYGWVVEISHNHAWRSLYAHVKAIKVATGQGVISGQLIALVGASGRATGPHLHLEIRRAKQAIDPLALWGLATP